MQKNTQNYKHNEVNGSPEGKKLMTSSSSKSSRTFGMLFTVIHAVKASSKICTLLGSNLDVPIHQKLTAHDILTAKGVCSNKHSVTGEMMQTCAVAGRLFICESA